MYVYLWDMCYYFQHDSTSCFNACNNSCAFWTILLLITFYCHFWIIIANFKIISLLELLLETSCSVKWSCNLVVASILINSRGYTGYTIHKVAIQLLAALLNEVYEYSYWHPRFVCDRCTPCLYNVQSTPNTLRKHENKGKLIKPVSLFLVVISG